MISIKVVNSTASETETADLLKSLIMDYDLGEFEFTNEVLIDENSIPHSHPILTLHTRHLGEPNLLLATYLHEQLHWFVESIPTLSGTIESLKLIYPEVPIGRPLGAKSEYSSYLHLVVNLLEYIAVVKVLGEKDATEVFNFWEKDHYTWIYKTVRKDFDKLAQLLEENDLIPNFLLTD